MPVRVRSGTPEDREFVITTARRFASFGPPAWRTPAEVVGGEVRCLDEFYDGLMPGCELLIAEDDGHVPLGFAFLEPHVDYFSQETHGHLGMIAVADGAEGRGVGAALMTAAEAWALDRGYRKLTLNVFEENARARQLYERFGFKVETVRYTKPLG